MFYAKMYAEEKQKQDFRLLLGYIASYAGMGSSSPVNIQTLYPTPLYDNVYKEKPIKTIEEAMEILNILVNG